MEKVVSKRDDFIVDTLFNLRHCRDFSTGVMDSVLGVPVTERASFAVTGEEIFISAVSLGKEIYSGLL